MERFNPRLGAARCFMLLFQQQILACRCVHEASLETNDETREVSHWKTHSWEGLPMVATL